MKVEHLHSDAKLFFQVGELLARAQVLASVRDATRLGRLSALEKPDGGVVAGDVVRRLVARS